MKRLERLRDMAPQEPDPFANLHYVGAFGMALELQDAIENAARNGNDGEYAELQKAHKDLTGVYYGSPHL